MSRQSDLWATPRVTSQGLVWSKNKLKVFLLAKKKKKKRDKWQRKWGGGGERRQSRREGKAGREKERVCVCGGGCDLLCDRAPQQTCEGLQLWGGAESGWIFFIYLFFWFCHPHPPLLHWVRLKKDVFMSNFFFFFLHLAVGLLTTESGRLMIFIFSWKRGVSLDDHPAEWLCRLRFLINSAGTARCTLVLCRAH